MNRIVILGGGTFSPIRNHLSLCAPAFGNTARILLEILRRDNHSARMYLTKMADSSSKLLSNEDVKDLIDSLLLDPTVKTIVMNVAMCDFYADIPDRGFHGDRLKTSDGDITLTLKPSEKVISSIKKARPDIFLVGFKTTTGFSKEDQFQIAIKMLKSSQCNLVLANDTVTRHNMIVTPEEDRYEPSASSADARREILEKLAEIISANHDNDLV